MNCIEHEVLKDLPGYKAILKAVLKNQIQNLVEQLSKEAEEETVLLSVSTADGTLSHLGSLYGKDFLQDKDDIKFQFLTHCLKKKQSKHVNSAVTTNVPKDDIEQPNKKFFGDQPQKQIWQHSTETIPNKSQENDSDKLIETTFQNSQDEFPNANAHFSETLTVNGEKLIVQTNPVKRKRKRKPSYIPNTQRIKNDDTNINVKMEEAEDFCDTEPSALDESDLISSQADDADVSTIKVEPLEDSMENSMNSSTNDSSAPSATESGYQHDIPLMRAGQHDMPLMIPENAPGLSSGGVPAAQGLYTCTECGMVYSCASGLHYHMKIHNRNLQVCNRCGYKCVRKTQLLAHIFKHHDPTGAPFCYICQKMFTRTDKLTEHNKRFHRGPLGEAWKQVVTTLGD